VLDARVQPEHQTHPTSDPSLVSQDGAEDSALLDTEDSALFGTDESMLQDALAVLRNKSSPSSLRKLGRAKLVLLCTSVLEPGDVLYKSGKLTVDKMVERLMTWVCAFS